VDAEALNRCQKKLGYVFANPRLLELALTHSSVAPTKFDSNERIEFLGDAVLGLVACQELYEAHTDLLEGEMTKIKSAVVSRQTCAEIANQLGLCDELMMGKGIGSPDKLPQSIPAAVLEALIGAIYLDGGVEPARRFVLEHLRPQIQASVEDRHQRNYKSMLQQHAQREWSVTPSYQLLDEKGPDHNRAFEIAASIDGRSFPSAWGTNKKDAEQQAARQALMELGLLEDEAQSLQD